MSVVLSRTDLRAYELEIKGALRHYSASLRAGDDEALRRDAAEIARLAGDVRDARYKPARSRKGDAA